MTEISRLYLNNFRRKMFEWLEVLNVSLVLLLSNLFTVGTNNNLGL